MEAEIYVEARGVRGFRRFWELCLEEKRVLFSVQSWPLSAEDVIAFTKLWTNIGIIIPQEKVKVN